MTSVPADGPGRPGPDGAVPDNGAVLDRSCLTDLADQLASPEAASEFAAVFLEMLPERVQAIEEPLADTRVQAARTAALSLGSSAAMIGAQQLVRDAGLINQHLKTGSLDAAREVAARLSADASAVAAAIEELLAGQ
ncbi:Hpt domain-containing protein [Pseudarthrobacter equi]|uniref:Hpt domain-containing protein n=1 Tax=Pseudarthrobacter equi TaxID=728066 RepID=UPI0028D5752E|nr:Hpt domain-containing protein [Pseudarthrobacter equi]